jgi:3-phenylpropionate/trans-cinnamate dioxygenase ferredoxin subunit
VAHLLTLGRLDEFPAGKMRSFDIGGQEVVIAHAGGRYYAFGGICTHRFEHLTDGFLEGENIICAYHEATYDMRTGAAIEGPTVDGVPVWPLQVSGDALQIEWPEPVDESTIAETKHEAGMIGD